ncbi:MAG: hypothetical protein FJ119_08065 [Deltaproteobacteria bacterium]|nr:hypothetical protein [Deltaproteobacteria bacterium]
MNKHYMWIIGSLVLLLVAINAQAFYFSIQLHNGNEMKTAQYWEDGDKISFYTRSGTVSVPRAMIKNITKVDGSLESETVYSTPELLGIMDEEPEEELFSPQDETGVSAERTEEFIADLRDRLNIINSNIENLGRNRELFIRQREGYEQDRQRAQDRIAEAKKESLLSAADRAERIQLENAKTSDTEAKMARVDEQLRNNARLIDAQNKMKARVEKELADLTR